LLYSVYFINNETGYIAGEGAVSGTILKTTNGGLNWISQNSGTVNDLFAIYFCNENTGYVVGESGTILKTNDGGASWTGQLSGTSNSLFAMNFFDPEVGYVAGDYGTILMTTNGGISVGGVDKIVASSHVLKIFPNPSLNVINVESSQEWVPGQLSVMNMKGEVMISRQTNGSQTQLDLSNLPYGIYFVRLTSSRSAEVGKFVKL
jgi:hypothetical protein